MSLIRQILIKTPQRAQWVKSSITAPLCRSMAVGSRDAPLLDVETALAKPEDLAQKNKLSNTITVPVSVDISPISGVPSEHVKTRRVRIHIPSKHSMQSGTHNINYWEIEFDTRERWENPLMGWISSGDPLSNMDVQFNTKDEAIAHCEKNGWRWFIDDLHHEKKERVKNYGINFSWNKRTRVSTK